MGSSALATEPCEDFGECKALIEINASDGDIGFHFLMDGDDLNAARIFDPDNKKVFPDPDAEEDWEDIVTLEEFLERWTAGTYRFWGRSDEGERSEGETELTYMLPAAPADVDFNGTVITWDDGDDLGNCASYDDLNALVADGTLPEHPMNVAVDAYEVVLEPDVEDGDPTGALVYSIRVPGDIAIKSVTVPAEYLASLPDDTPVKVEVGAIGGEDNATFTEEDGFCVNEDEGCDD
jgi:hypothetical protein